MHKRAGLNLNLLEVVMTLAEEGSVSAAAVRLGVSQPAVSGSLAKLREHFDDPLFVRSKLGMSPTPRGAEIAGIARDLLRQVEERLQDTRRFDPHAAHRPFTFALSDVGEIVFLPKLVELMSANSPRNAVRSVSMPPDRLVDALASGEVDLAVGYFPDLKGDDFFQQKLFTHHFTCLVRSGHPLQGNRLTRSEFQTVRHAVVQSEGRSQEILEDFLTTQGIKRQVAVYTPHFLSIPKLIAASDLLVTVPHAVGIAYGHPSHGLRTIGLPFPSPHIDLRQHWHRKMHKDPRNVWLRRIVCDLFNADTDEWRSDLSLQASKLKSFAVQPGT